MKKALIVIDVQNFYFANGSYPLWNMDTTVANIEKAIVKAKESNIPVVLVQHLGKDSTGESEGEKINSRILNLTPDSKVVIKHYADAFYQTNFEEVLSELGIEELLICGMMTHNCVAHTSISRAADKYTVKVLTDCCTTIDQAVHETALRAFASWDVELVKMDSVL